MNKKLVIGVGVLIVLGVGGYFIYKKMTTPSRKMFDEMVSNCKPPCDVFSNITEQQLNKLFKGFQTLSKEEAQFLVDSLPRPSDEKRYNMIWHKMVKNIK